VVKEYKAVVKEYKAVVKEYKAVVKESTKGHGEGVNRVRPW
jgi:hypothetical protein